MAAVVAGTVAAALGGRTWLRAHDWVDGLTFYQQTIRDGGDTPRMREGLALAHLDHGDFAVASALLSDMVTRYPSLLSIRVNLAIIQARSGHSEEARAAFERLATDLIAPAEHRGGPREYNSTIRALDHLEPPDSPAWIDLRQALLQRVAQRFPKSWDSVCIAISDRESAGDSIAALDLATSFADTHWWHLPSHLTVARLLAVAGRTDETLAVLRRAASLDIHGTDVPAVITALCLEHGHLDEALAWQQTAVHRQPDSPRQRLLLASVFERQGRATDANHEREFAARLVNVNKN